VVEEQIFPHLSTGFTDENAYIRELTLKSMMVLAPKLKQATLTGNVLKHLSKLQVCLCPHSLIMLTAVKVLS
jgi:SCY1-like protein 1